MVSLQSKPTYTQIAAKARKGALYAAVTTALAGNAGFAYTNLYESGLANKILERPVNKDSKHTPCEPLDSLARYQPVDCATFEQHQKVTLNAATLGAPLAIHYLFLEGILPAAAKANKWEQELRK